MYKKIRYLIVLMLVLPGAASAQYVYTSGVGSCSSGPECTDITIAYYQSGTCSSSTSVVGHEAFPQYGGTSAQAWIDTAVRCDGSGYGPIHFVGPAVPVECTFNGTSGAVECAQECPFTDGEEFIKSGGNPKPAGFCNEGCSFSVKAGAAQVQFQTDWIGVYSVTGSCSPDDGILPDTGLNCLQTAAGTQYCVDPVSVGNCGTVNGEYQCLDAVPPGNCLLTPGGQAICDGGSQVNSPDDTVTDQDGNDYDIYTSGNTGGTVGGDGATAGTSDVNGDGVADGEGMPGEDCPAWENCDETHSGTTPAIDDDGCDFNCITSGFYSDIANGPLISSVSGLAWTSGSSACPSPTITLFGESFLFDGHCAIGAEIQSVLAIAFLGIWFLFATRVFLSA